MLGRRELTSGAILLRTEQGQARVQRVASGIVLVEMGGVAEIGLAVPLFRELESLLFAAGALRLFADASQSKAHDPEFRESLCRWLVTKGGKVSTHMLIERSVVGLGYALAGLGDRLVVHRERAPFEAELRLRVMPTARTSLPDLNRDDGDW